MSELLKPQRFTFRQDWTGANNPPRTDNGCIFPSSDRDYWWILDTREDHVSDCHMMEYHKDSLSEILEAEFPEIKWLDNDYNFFGQGKAE